VYQLVADLPPERFTALYAALPDEMRQALDAPVAACSTPVRPSCAASRRRSRSQALRAFLARERDDTLSGEILRSYFLGPRKPLVVAFLDATGVKHEDGQVADESAPDRGQGAEARRRPAGSARARRRGPLPAHRRHPVAGERGIRKARTELTPA
jgi:hypothetical protein